MGSLSDFRRMGTPGRITVMDSLDEAGKWVLMSKPDSDELWPGLMFERSQTIVLADLWEEVPLVVLERWAQDGTVEAAFAAGKLLLEQGEHARAFRHFAAGAYREDAPSMFYLGMMYGSGLGQEADQLASLYWYTRAAEGGNSDAQYNLGQRYLSADGVEQDIELAVHWYEQAALQGDPEANYNLGVMYLIGDLIAQDHGRARKFLKTALSLGVDRAREFLDALDHTDA
jgi:TPR repeat protein